MTAVERSETIIKSIKEALKNFGEYSYYDKGAEEVMDVPSSQFRNLSADEAVKTLLEVLKFEHGEPCVSAILYELQDMPDAWFDTVLSNQELANIY